MTENSSKSIFPLPSKSADLTSASSTRREGGARPNAIIAASISGASISPDPSVSIKSKAARIARAWASSPSSIEPPPPQLLLSTFTSGPPDPSWSSTSCRASISCSLVSIFTTSSVVTLCPLSSCVASVVTTFTVAPARVQRPRGDGACAAAWYVDRWPPDGLSTPFVKASTNHLVDSSSSSSSSPSSRLVVSLASSMSSFTICSLPCLSKPLNLMLGLAAATGSQLKSFTLSTGVNSSRGPKLGTLGQPRGCVKYRFMCRSYVKHCALP
mmetsp:Transcript_43745/g.80899  ORF Transcript_43745/g.80899 Transcript_43745/m.80899 type:complete len:270 (-) Transcript_43745:128-937(-)